MLSLGEQDICEVSQAVSQDGLVSIQQRDREQLVLKIKIFREMILKDTMLR